MAKSFKVAQKYQAADSHGKISTYFTVDGLPPSPLEKSILEDLKEELGWPMFIYESHVEDHWGNVVQN